MQQITRSILPHGVVRDLPKDYPYLVYKEENAKRWLLELNAREMAIAFKRVRTWEIGADLTIPIAGGELGYREWSFKVQFEANNKRNPAGFCYRYGTELPRDVNFGYPAEEPKHEKDLSASWGTDNYALDFSAVVHEVDIDPDHPDNPLTNLDFRGTIERNAFLNLFTDVGRIFNKGRQSPFDWWKDTKYRTWPKWTVYGPTIGSYSCYFTGSVQPESYGPLSLGNPIDVAFSCYGVDKILTGAAFVPHESSPLVDLGLDLEGSAYIKAVRYWTYADRARNNPKFNERTGEPLF